LLVVADGAAWVVDDDGPRRQLGEFSDATWSPNGLFVAATRGNELVALEPTGAERWTRPAAGRVSVPRWSPDGYRIAYRSGRDLRVVWGNNGREWLLQRSVAAVPPAWKPLPEPAGQVLAFAASGRVRIVEVDTRREVGLTPPGPTPREIWWAQGGRRLVTVTARSVRIHGPSGRLLRTVDLPLGETATGSALAPGGRRLALTARRGEASRLLLVRLDRAAPPRPLLSSRGVFHGISWSIDGSLLVVGVPQADQWLFVRPRGSVPLESVPAIRDTFHGGREPIRGEFPRPAGWCRREPVDRTASGQPPCSLGSAP
jgi:dipeptidyl aminopeptidase/acylaminoacyl peptidase